MVSSPGPSEYQAAVLAAMGPVARIRLHVAGDPHLTRLLDELDDDTWLADRTAVAEDLGTPPDVLAVLAADPDPDVRAAVAANESTPTEVLDRLAADGGADGWLIRATVAVHPNTDPDTVARLAVDPDPHVRQAAAGNPRRRPPTPAERSQAGLLAD